MVIEIDVRGLACPQPVMMVKKVIDAGEAQFLVLANDPVATSNLQRLAENNGFMVDSEKKPDGNILMRMKKK